MKTTTDSSTRSALAKASRSALRARSCAPNSHCACASGGGGGGAPAGCSAADASTTCSRSRVARRAATESPKMSMASSSVSCARKRTPEASARSMTATLPRIMWHNSRERLAVPKRPIIVAALHLLYCARASHNARASSRRATLAAQSILCASPSQSIRAAASR